MNEAIHRVAVRVLRENRLRLESTDLRELVEDSLREERRLNGHLDPSMFSYSMRSLEENDLRVRGETVVKTRPGQRARRVREYWLAVQSGAF